MLRSLVGSEMCIRDRYYKDQMIILDDMNKYIHIYSKHNKLDTMSSKPGNTIYIPLGYISVSYTHLTLPTIYSV